MATQYSDIKAKIKTELETIALLEKVYSYKKGDLNAYPVACIEEMSGSSEPMSINTASREMLWTIRIYQEMEKDGVGAEEAENRIDAIVDALWDLFDEKWKLDCNVDNAFISSISTEWEEREVSMRIISIQLNITKLFDL